ncbi:hypothetical protein LOS15_02505 [Halomonas sp. 7T]|uniref:hypothetical protein n=1 Tax=Halomonas sp. 7T TaxID=2893469 RepID=UPI0021D9ADEF|nr:hypothetical protein [Halomonas sp. 7T]UXZ54927.1 hypothetical protein LOS15_02505 [Halomonas sp. 7T]
MTLTRAYYLLAGFYTLIPIMGVVALFSGGGTPLAIAHLALGALAVVGLWGYILKRGFMNPRMWRPFAILLAIGAVLQLVVIFTMPVANIELTWMLTSTVFSVLLVILLYHYGNRDQPLWATPEEQAAARQLSALLETSMPLTAVHREGERENSVNVSKEGDEYKARITRRTHEQHEAFEQRFKHPETLVFFLEKFASVTVQDFKQQHAS